MLRAALRSALFLWVSTQAWESVQAGSFLVVTRTADGWSLQAVESVTVNGKEKLRGAGSAGNTATWDAKSIGKLAEEQLSSFVVVRRAADGALLGRTGAGDWQALLPEASQTKTAEPAASLWKSAIVAVKKDHKDKSASSIRTDEIYAILPGADPAASAGMLATDISLHHLPGMTEGDAFAQMVAFMPAAVKTFPESAKTVHEYLAQSISAHIRTWQDGDAAVTVLNEAMALTSAADAAFPGDSALSASSTQVRNLRKWLDRRVAILRALDAGKQSDAFLAGYHDFEIFDKSFPQLSKARLAHMQASAKLHLETAKALRDAGDYLDAIRHLLIARWRDSKLTETNDVLEQVRLEVAKLSSQKYAEIRQNVDPRSPAQVQVQRRLLLAEQYMNDGKPEEAEKALAEAETIDKDEPRVTLLQAKLAVTRGDLGKALALLDNYAGIAITPLDFADGEKLRASVLYSIQTSADRTRGELSKDMDQQRFAAALESAADGLKLDNENPDFLYEAGVNACVLRHCDRAAPLLHRFLDLTDSADADHNRRIAAVQLLREAESAAQTDPKLTRKPPEAAEVSWFSGGPLEHATLYDPISLAFQPKVSRIDASDHLTVAYEWTGNQLRSVHAKYEEKKTGGNIARLAGAAAASAGGLSTTLAWKSADRETNDFYFNYYDDVPQVLKVSRDNAVVKGTTKRISIPGIGIYGPFAGIGALGALSNLGRLGSLGQMGSLGALAGRGSIGGLPSFGNVSSLGSIGGTANLGGAAGIMSSVSGAGRMPGISGFMSSGAGHQLSPQTYSVVNDPQGGSSAGFLTLWNSPRLDTRLAFKATGKRAAVGFAGNSYFHPFIWDGIHLFEFDYDDQGRVRHAWELDNPGAPRLDFAWDGQRLLKITGRDSGGGVVYSRTLNYSNERLTSESISSHAGNSHIEYKYGKTGRLVEADCDADRSIDGRSRKIYFADDDKGKR